MHLIVTDRPVMDFFSCSCHQILEENEGKFRQFRPTYIWQLLMYKLLCSFFNVDWFLDINNTEQDKQ